MTHLGIDPHTTGIYAPRETQIIELREINMAGAHTTEDEDDT